MPCAGVAGQLALCGSNDASHQLPHVRALAVQKEALLVESRNIQEIGNQVVKPVGFLHDALQYLLLNRRRKGDVAPQ